MLSDLGLGLDTCFSPDGKHILVRCCCIILPCTGLGHSQIEGFDFVFIHCGCDEGRTVSVHWIMKMDFQFGQLPQQTWKMKGCVRPAPRSSCGISAMVYSAGFMRWPVSSSPDYLLMGNIWP